ncbi:unnamed protein product [Miscanthus lutarioriparius]|uniref:RRM domain-containing protein n=1 Tax=Miscanthus lutarioriparius TaxID=422564 RepID=A0A811RAT1_9POAL|nr:unnamed protein product [Miscanthus lutarioriparius]
MMAAAATRARGGPRRPFAPVVVSPPPLPASQAENRLAREDAPSSFARREPRRFGACTGKVTGPAVLGAGGKAAKKCGPGSSPAKKTPVAAKRAPGTAARRRLDSCTKKCSTLAAGGAVAAYEAPRAPASGAAEEGDDEVRAKLSYPCSEADQERRGSEVSASRNRAMTVVAMEEAMAGLPEPGEGRVKYLVDTFERFLSLGGGGGGGGPMARNRGAARRRKGEGTATATATVSLPATPRVPRRSTCRTLPLRRRPRSPSRSSPVSPASSTPPTAQAGSAVHEANGGRGHTTYSTGSSDRPWSCSRKVTRVTTQQPFRLWTEQRGKAKEGNFLERLRKMQREEERLRHPLAQGLPYTTDEPEIPTKPPTKEPTEPIDHVLHSDVRVVRRVKFDTQVAERNSFMEEVKLERERQQKLDEEIEINQLRKEQVPRAHPMPDFSKPFVPKSLTISAPKKVSEASYNSQGAKVSLQVDEAHLKGAMIFENRRTAKGTEVFVGGLPRSATESTLREIFSSCGEIIDVRIMKDQNGHSKGYGFVRFSKREYANTAKRQKNGIELQGKRLHVDLSMDQDTVFFGNLCKEWTLEEFEELIRKTFKDVVSVDLAMASNLGSSNKRNINRGFAFVRFSSHAAAARVIRIGSRTDFMLGDILHPAINWADKESHVDPDEMAKIKSAFVGNLPEDVSEEYLRKLFEQFSEVVRVAISRKGQGPVGFVHFANRSELENAIEEMDGKTVRGPNRGPSFRIQVSVARPVADNDKKRSREEVRTRRSNVSGDRQDYSHGRYGHDSLDRQVKAPRLSNYIDIHCVKSLNELPESSALAVLNQFLISGGDKRNKGDYFASLIAKHQAEAFGLTHTLHGTTYLPRNPEIHSKRYPDEDYDFVTPGSSRYNSSGHHPSTYYVDDPPVSQSRIRRYAEERSTIVRNPEPCPRHDEIDIRMNPEPRLAYESRHNTGKHLDRRYIQEHSSNIERSAEEAVLSRERRFLPAAGYKAGYNTDVGSDFRSRSPAEYSAERQQVRFDPFTGEPYKFDPFTGEPIRPDPNPRRSGSLY